ncbi:MAG: peroxiredoxin [Dehalococcoidia bacterium]|nr:MAG: peroxiredoxin [Dehalococcoidia bacterium]
MIREGDQAPDFTLPTVDGTVSLADFRGKQPVLLYWYPKDDTPGCTTEACAFRDNIAALQSRGVAVLGASPDSVKSHEKFAKKHGLPFPLLADEDHSVAEAYGVWVEKSMYGKKYFGIERTTFLIGPDGTVQRVWRKVNPNKHVAEVIAALDEMQSTATA